MGEYRLVVDQSTSGTKVLLFETEGDVKIIDRKDKKHKQVYPKEGWIEHNPDEIILNVYELIDDILNNNNLSYEDVLSISLTNQRESVLVWDKQSGKALSPIMVWQCNRGLNICKKLWQQGFDEKIKNKTGLRIDPYFSASKLKWYFNEKHNEIMDLNNLAIGTIDTWLIWNMTNRESYVTEISNASRTMLFNIFTCEWDSELCNIFDVPIQCLAKVVESTYEFGEYKGIPIVSVLADSQASLYGNSCKKYGQVKATLGTGSSIMMNVGSEVKELDDKILTTISWLQEGGVNYALEGIIKSYSDNLNWLESELGLITDIGRDSDIALNLDSSESVLYIPALEGLGAPFWNPGILASFSGISRKTNKSHIIRAVFDAMAFQTKSVIREMEEVSKIVVEKIIVDGGPVKNKKFMQLLSDVTQKQIVVSEFEEASAFGALNIYLKKEMNTKALTSYFPKTKSETQYYEWLCKINQKLGGDINEKETDCNNRSIIGGIG
ncbi:glycerol kinase [Aerococcaceae bacterium zg-BR9]|uniref:FGGY-family carbohydrate kinase n=1 Tax=Aerococcaceae bacterium zg-1292 TaxID=2774330 RepID=UPI004063DAF3|nr:glycerol kinase [Aerococcaceae bacterium zg-BR9]